MTAKTEASGASPLEMASGPSRSQRADTPIRPRRYLVTGGLGYSGAWVTTHLAAAGHEVFALSRGNSQPDLGQPYTLLRADLERQSPEEIAAVLPRNLDGVVHTASCNDAFAPDYPQKALLTNALGTRNLLEAFVLHKNSCGSFPLLLCFSTVHVYGLDHKGTTSSGKTGEAVITENTAPAPGNDYALTHWFAEEYCRMFMRITGLPVITMRMTNGYGAPKTRQSSKWYLLLNDLCRMAATDGQIVLHSEGHVQRDFIWLGDVARTAEALLLRPELAGSIFNVSHGKGRSIGEIAELVASLATSHFKKVVPTIYHTEHLPENAGRQMSGYLPPLHVSNAALQSATGINMQDKMSEEIQALFQMLEKG